MRKKNIIILFVSIVVFVIAVALLFRFVFPPSQGNDMKVIYPHPVNPNFDASQLKTLKNNVKFYDQNIKPTSMAPDHNNLPASVKTSNLHIETRS